MYKSIMHRRFRTKQACYTLFSTLPRLWCDVVDWATIPAPLGALDISPDLRGNLLLDASTYSREMTQPPSLMRDSATFVTARTFQDGHVSESTRSECVVDRCKCIVYAVIVELCDWINETLKGKDHSRPTKNPVQNDKTSCCGCCS